MNVPAMIQSIVEKEVTRQLNALFAGQAVKPVGEKNKGGWPKGKPRGPRKAKEAAAGGVEGPSPVAPEAAAPQPVVSTIPLQQPQILQPVAAPKRSSKKAAVIPGSVPIPNPAA